MAPALSVYPVRGPAFTPTAAYERAPYLFAAENPLKTGVGGPIPVAAHYGGFSASASPGQTPDTTPRSPLFYVRDPSLPQTFPERGAESAEGESMDKTGVNDEDEVVPPWSWTPSQSLLINYPQPDARLTHLDSTLFFCLFLMPLSLTAACRPTASVNGCAR